MVIELFFIKSTNDTENVIKTTMKCAIKINLLFIGLPINTKTGKTYILKKI